MATKRKKVEPRDTRTPERKDPYPQWASIIETEAQEVGNHFKRMMTKLIADVSIEPSGIRFDDHDGVYIKYRIHDEDYLITMNIDRVLLMSGIDDDGEVEMEIEDIAAFLNQRVHEGPQNDEE